MIITIPYNYKSYSVTYCEKNIDGDVQIFIVCGDEIIDIDDEAYEAVENIFIIEHMPYIEIADKLTQGH